MCRITLYSLNKDDDTHIPNLIAMNLRVHSFFLPSFSVETDVSLTKREKWRHGKRRISGKNYN